MEIFDELIRSVNKLLPAAYRRYEPVADPERFAGHRSELILGKETAYELGGGNNSCVTTGMYTENPELVPEDEIIVFGKDLPELKKDTSFARIAYIRTDDIGKQGEQGAYGILENIGLKKYDVFPKGYMVRTSALSNREQVRISKSAVKSGLCFADVGSLYIREFKKNRHVQAVKMIFVTVPDLNYPELDHLGNLANELFRALNHLVSDLKMNCRACEWKTVCDEVDGMKQLHEKMLQNQHEIQQQEELS